MSSTLPLSSSSKPQSQGEKDTKQEEEEYEDLLARSEPARKKRRINEPFTDETREDTKAETTGWSKLSEGEEVDAKTEEGKETKEGERDGSGKGNGGTGSPSRRTTM